MIFETLLIMNRSDFEKLFRGELNELFLDSYHSLMQFYGQSLEMSFNRPTAWPDLASFI